MSEHSVQDFIDAMDRIAQAIGDAVTPVWTEMVNSLSAFMVSVRRRYVFLRLPRWLPLRFYFPAYTAAITGAVRKP